MTRCVALLLLLLVFTALDAPAARAGLLTYTLSGGDTRISGTVGSTEFINASFVMTATADSSGVTYGTIGLIYNAYFLPATVNLTLDWTDGAVPNSLTVEMLPSGNLVDYSYGVLSYVDSMGAGSKGFAAVLQRSGIGPVSEFTVDQGLFAKSDPSAVINLKSLGRWDGQLLRNGNLNTEEGFFSFTVTNGTTASFEITEPTAAAVPEPASLGLLGGVAGVIALVRHRRRSAVAR